ncbi:MAG: hypothetical protein OXF01_03090, partial [Gemmatimonadetes bacterium]|nr:hypothetical protein [Gemmatimonadota bacterium]
MTFLSPPPSAALRPRPSAIRRLGLLPLAAILLSGAARPEASPHGSGPATAADTLRVSLSAPDGGTVAEGAEGSFSVTVGGSTAGGAVTVSYSVSGTATPGSDYTALSGQVTVARGDSTATIVLSALTDDILDDGETVVLALTDASGGTAVLMVDTAAAGATITDDGEVTVEITPAGDSVPEGGTWTGAVTLSTAVAEPVSVRWRTSDGTAVSNRDYGGMSAEVVFAPGERSKPIAVKTMKDGVSELAEMFYVALDGAAAARGTRAAAHAGSRVRIDTERRSGYIECNVEYPDGPWTIHTVGVPSGTDVGTPVVPAEEGNLAYSYSLAGGGERFEIHSDTGQISTTDSIVWSSGLSYSLTVTAEHTCGASGSIEVEIIVKTAPEPVDSIPKFEIEVDSTGSVDVSGKFLDRDGDLVLHYSASSSEPDVASVTTNGSWVVVTGRAGGIAIVTATATDPWGFSGTQEFEVEVVDDPPCMITVRPDTITAPHPATVPTGTQLGIVPVDHNEHCGDLRYGETGNSADLNVTERGVIEAARPLAAGIYQLDVQVTGRGAAATGPVWVEVLDPCMITVRPDTITAPRPATIPTGTDLGIVPED